MKVLLKEQHLIVVPENDAEIAQLDAWKAPHEGHVLGIMTQGRGLALVDLGERPVVCREAINITSRHPDPTLRLISNLAETPFELEGLTYRSVESFWQGLKFPTRARRLELAEMDGAVARKVGQKEGYGASIQWNGEKVAVGTWAHWQLMEKACRAKFTVHAEARAALLGTGERPLMHRVRRDSQTIPGVIMADIWMRLRRNLANATGVVKEEDE